jgi:hypothetical protein
VGQPNATSSRTPVRSSMWGFYMDTDRTGFVFLFTDGAVLTMQSARPLPDVSTMELLGGPDGTDVGAKLRSIEATAKRASAQHDRFETAKRIHETFKATATRVGIENLTSATLVQALPADTRFVPVADIEHLRVCRSRPLFGKPRVEIRLTSGAVVGQARMSTSADARRFAALCAQHIPERFVNDYR